MIKNISFCSQARDASHIANRKKKTELATHNKNELNVDKIKSNANGKSINRKKTSSNDHRQTALGQSIVTSRKISICIQRNSVRVSIVSSTNNKCKWNGQLSFVSSRLCAHRIDSSMINFQSDSQTESESTGRIKLIASTHKIEIRIGNCLAKWLRPMRTLGQRPRIMRSLIEFQTQPKSTQRDIHRGNKHQMRRRSFSADFVFVVGGRHRKKKFIFTHRRIYLYKMRIARGKNLN